MFPKKKGETLKLNLKKKKSSNKFGPSTHLIVDTSWSLTRISMMLYCKRRAQRDSLYGEFF